MKGKLYGKSNHERKRGKSEYKRRKTSKSDQKREKKKLYELEDR